MRNAFFGAVLCVGLFAGCGPQGEAGAEPSAVSLSALTGPMPYRGVNLASAEFGVDPYGVGSLPGTYGSTYVYPDAASSQYFLDKGMTTMRLPFRWERLQPTRRAALNATELSRMRATVEGITNRGGVVLLDPHNYARYGSAVIGSAALPNSDFADFWSRLAQEFKANPSVLFGLMNEPHHMPTEQWVAAANAAIAAIRATGATNLILVPGNGWTGGHSWTKGGYGTANGTALLAIQDPGNNYAFEVHQYFDTTFGGSSSSCVATNVGAAVLGDFTQWLRAHGKKGFVGEFATGTSATCMGVLEGTLSYLDQNTDVYLGWTYWAAGPLWSAGNWYNIEPTSTGADKPQMDVLERHLASPTPPATTPPATTPPATTPPATTPPATTPPATTPPATTPPATTPPPDLHIPVGSRAPAKSPSLDRDRSALFEVRNLGN